ncbi:multicopper oxidase-domain-containing protein [Chlamydoabsidia padenii]|nr:multicopper oxidase-domain-containing protein [Chlamydoabsidia padenii]
MLYCLLSLLACWLLVIFGVHCAHTRHYEFNLTMNTLNPDCSPYTSKSALLINGQIPGPTLTASKGDRILVHFRNQLPITSQSNSNFTRYGEGLDSNSATLHFHGVHQTGTPHSDGVPYLTQDPVKPGGGRYLYDFRVGDQSGTYFYHAHVGLQDFYGAFIVYESDDADPRYKRKQQQRLSLGFGNKTISFDDERTLILSEWHHRDRSDLESFIIGPNYTHIPDSDSLLINGKAVFNNNKSHTSDSCSGYHVISVEANNTYRLRIIGATNHRILGFVIAHHQLTIIEVDGYLVEPYETDYLEVAPGQRFSVLLTTNQPDIDYRIGTTRRFVTNKTVSDSLHASDGWAVLHYQNNKTTSSSNHQPPSFYTLPQDRPTFPVTDTPQWIWDKLKPLNDKHITILQRPPSRTILLDTTNKRELRGGEWVQRFYTNNITFEPPKSTLLRQILDGTRTPTRYTPAQLMENSTHRGYDPDLGTYPLASMEIVDFVIQNTYTPGKPCHQHPWHSHGHSHWLIAYGSGTYDETQHGHIRNVPTPILRDTTTVYPAISLDQQDNMTKGLDGGTSGCGWSKIRIIADNPGVWALHCHITPHMLQGMMVVLEESADLIRSHSHLVKLAHRSPLL